MPEQELEEKRREDQKHERMQQSGQQSQAEQLRDLLQNPKVVELLTGVGDDEMDATAEDAVGEHLHIDQVLSILDRDDLWRKGWKNKMWGTRVKMRYPFPESRADDSQVQRIQDKIRGTDRRPLHASERHSIESVFERKTDRENRAKDGTFVELLLSQVVQSEERNRSSDSDGGLLSFGGE